MPLQKCGAGAQPQPVGYGGASPPISKNLQLLSIYKNKTYQINSGHILDTIGILLSFLTMRARVGSGSIISWILFFLASEREMEPSSLLNPPNESSSMMLEGEGGGAGEGGEAEPAAAILRKSAQKS